MYIPKKNALSPHEESAIVLLIENSERRQSFAKMLNTLGFNTLQPTTYTTLKTENFPENSILIVDEENTNQTIRKVISFKKQHFSELLPFIVLLTQKT